jgi:hypothetical protein
LLRIPPEKDVVMSALTSFGGLVLVLAVGRPAEAPAAKGPPAVVALIEDAPEDFLRSLTGNTPGTSQVTRDFRDVYSGVCSLRVTPMQRFAERLPGWSYPVAEKPGPGQYRYLRFAWKRAGGTGIMIQIHNTAGSWNQRYYAGALSPSVVNWGPMLRVAEAAPAEWTVVTRDLFKDFGPMTITGFALTPMDGGAAGLFDHVYLGRTVADLDRATAAAFGKEPLPEPLAPARLKMLWEDLASRDVAVAGTALRELLAGRKEAVPFLARHLKARPLTADEKHILELIAGLDANAFRVREAASRELEKIGDAAVPFLQVAARDGRSLEVRRRARAVLDHGKFEEAGLTTGQLRLLRVIRVLEWSGTAEARQALEAAAGGPLEAAGLTADARRALERLRQSR